MDNLIENIVNFEIIDIRQMDFLNDGANDTFTAPV